MILTYNVKHGRDFTEELNKAREVAEFALEHKSFSSKDVKYIGLKSIIANQILRKYTRNKNLKRINRINLTIPNQGINVDKEQRIIRIPSLKIGFPYQFPNHFTKINQIEINKEYIFVSVTVPEEAPMETDNWIGIDLNTTGHVAVIANPETGKVKKLGKKAEHIHKKYKNIRREMQKAGKYRAVKRLKKRESRIVKDMNHKISREIVDIAKGEGNGIKLEKLGGIRKRAKSSRSFRYSLHSWSFYQLQEMIEYKAKLLGVPIEYVNPYHTSKECSRCGSIGNRNGKSFKCPECGHVDHADSNAAFNIAMRHCIGQSVVDRDAIEGSTDTPQEAMVIRNQPQNPYALERGYVSRQMEIRKCPESMTSPN